ncbi:tetratricopeptide repeat protein [Rhizobium sp. CB3090]|uniref:tetratricopeptide repeat protein n=1 Tax=Rhizobium sp. CB3090 TaxID=3039156 RepID=UPI0024B14626|nr:tetratricopeptide repeat protein [Rhizobium sp. CB3090]WFU08161.1 tetratricopeptide repeat protein [Rhizobium sp. CB3090]
MKLARIIFALTLSIAFCTVRTVVLADPDEAFTAYQKSDYATAFKLYHERALKGDVSAQGMVGTLYAYGRGVKQDDNQAAFWFQKLAEQGNAKGQFALGGMYLAGRGVPQDYTKAAELFRNAAEQGEPFSALWLSMLYEQGQGVLKDPQQAAYWKKKSDENMPDISDILPPQQQK